MIGKVLRGTRARVARCTTCMGRGKRTSTPIRIWSPDSEIRPNLNRPAGQTEHVTSGALPGSLAQPLAALYGPGYDEPVCTVSSAPHPATGCCRTPNGPTWRPRPWTVPGWRRATMTRGCGGSRSGTPTITCTSWPRWPVRTGPGHGSGTISTGSAKRARPSRNGTGSGSRRRLTALHPAPVPGGDRAGRAARLGRDALRRAATRVHRRRRSTHRGRVLRHAGHAGVAGPPTVQHPAPRVKSPATRSACPAHRPGRRGGVVWRRQARGDLTLPKLRRRWAATPAEHGPRPGAWAVGPGGARRAAEHGHRRRGSRAQRAGLLRAAAPGGIRVRLRFSEIHPGQVTGISVGLPGRHGASRASRCGTAADGFPASSPCPGCAAAGRRPFRGRGTPREHGHRGADRSGSLRRNGTRSSRTRPAGPPRGGAHPAARGARSGRPGRTPRGRSPTRCTPRPGPPGAGSCGGRPTPPTARPAPPTAASPAAPPTVSGLRTAARAMVLIGTMSGDGIAAGDGHAHRQPGRARGRRHRPAPGPAARRASSRGPRHGRTPAHGHRRGPVAVPHVGQAQAPRRARPATAADLARHDIPDAWPGMPDTWPGMPVPVRRALPARPVLLRPGPPKRAGPGR